MKNLLAAILSLMFFAACENDVEDPDWPSHQEKLVVTGFLRLERDSVFAYARVNRTLPLGERFDLNKATINDAELRVDNGGRSFIFNRAQSNSPFGFDFNYSSISARSNDDDFVLIVRQGGKTATAVLQAKAAAVRFTEIRVEQPQVGFEEYLVSYNIPAPGQDTDVECLLEYWSTDFGYWYETYSLYLPNQANRPGGMLEGSFSIWAFDPSGLKTRIRYTLSARNRAYQEYMNSRWDWNGGESPFDPPGKNPAFNVTGDGIGFFWYEIVGEPVEIIY
ncbi:MAG: hypothetical protein WC824_01485 [Bacteroidota bacterium]|jgi:hypothetical protein